jgi:hypothetical protein
MRKLILLMAVILASNTSLGCGFCKEDKAAAVYNYQDQKSAQDNGEKYVVVEFANVTTPKDLSRLEGLLRSIKEIRPETVRVAYAQRSGAFVLKKNGTFEKVASTIASRSGVTLKIVKSL